MKNETYCVRRWLNKQNSPSTGSVVAYRGEMIFENGRHKTAFLEISDCHNKIRLHVTPMDTMNEFINKLELLNNEIESFIDFLRQEQKLNS